MVNIEAVLAATSLLGVGTIKATVRHNKGAVGHRGILARLERPAMAGTNLFRGVELEKVKKLAATSVAVSLTK